MEGDDLSADNKDYLSQGDISDKDKDDFAVVRPEAAVGVAVVNPEAAPRPEDEERELMLLEAAVHIKMARAQRAPYQRKVELAVAAALAKREHLEMVLTLGK